MKKKKDFRTEFLQYYKKVRGYKPLLNDELSIVRNKYLSQHPLRNKLMVIAKKFVKKIPAWDEQQIFTEIYFYSLIIDKNHIEFIDKLETIINNTDNPEYIRFFHAYYVHIRKVLNFKNLKEFKNMYNAYFYCRFTSSYKQLVLKNIYLFKNITNKKEIQKLVKNLYDIQSLVNS